MPKMKTNRGAAKRMRATGGGKIKRSRAFHRHQMSAKSTKQKRHHRHATMVDKSDEKNVRRLLPYA